MVVVGESVVAEPFEGFVIPFVIFDRGASCITVPERFTRCGGCVIVAAQIVVVERI